VVALDGFLRTPAAEVRIDEVDQRVSQVSTPTLLYMHEYGIALEGRLRWHGGNLRFLSDEEHDLLEAMRLCTRLTKVEKNIARTGRMNERMRAELVRREFEGRGGSCRVDSRLRFTEGEGR
jgi:hypothetical protein